MLTVHVAGTPVPQGSKRAFVNQHTGRANVVDDNKAKLRTWRDDVRAAVYDVMYRTHWTRIERPSGVSLGIRFHVDRPAGHYGTGRNARVVKPSAPANPTTKPDLDKLVRAILDALTSAGVYADDSQVVAIATWKVYTAPGGPSSGATINVTPLDAAPAVSAHAAAGTVHPTVLKQKGPTDDRPQERPDQ